MNGNIEEQGTGLKKITPYSAWDVGVYLFIYIFFFFLGFFWPHPWHMVVPSFGVVSAL